LSHEYRDRIYIRKDIILKLTEYGELNQTSLLSYCGLNLVKHKPILDDMEQKGIITKAEEPWGNKKTIIKYKVTEKGKEFCGRILEPYEEMFPRKETIYKGVFSFIYMFATLF
jgi:predicted transcriptional regulator